MAVVTRAFDYHVERGDSFDGAVVLDEVVRKVHN